MSEFYTVRLLCGDIVTMVHAESEEEAMNIAYEDYKERNPDIEFYDVQIDED